MKLTACLSLVLLFLLGCGRAKPHQLPAGTGFIECIFQDDSGVESKFTVFIPASYDSDTAYPAILFLHGAGQTGRDGKAQVRGGLAEAIRKRPETFGFITIFPQSHQGSWLADSSDAIRAMKILEFVKSKYNVDPTRTYLTGYSMGGEGTWSIASAHPEKFAAIVPICPSSNLDAVNKLKEMPCWCFQGDADAAITLNSTRKMVLALKEAGGKPIYQEYPGVGHNCWDLAYANEELFAWLLEQRRSDSN
jgi:predicted peptidase